MASAVQVSTFKAINVDGLIAWGELYNAVQSGMVEGVENNHLLVVTIDANQVGDHHTLGEHARPALQPSIPP